MTPQQYEKKYYSKLFAKPPLFKINDKVWVKHIDGKSPGRIVEVVFKTDRRYKVYMEDSFGYVWWNEKDLKDRK